MGGSGGGYGFNQHRNVHDLLQEAQEHERRAEYAQQVNHFLQDCLRDLNDRDTAVIRRHLDTVASALGSDIEGKLLLMFGGSTAKHTYVNGLSDVDMLVTLNESSLANSGPEEVLDYFVDRLRQRLPNTSVEKGRLAVTVRFSDGHEVQLLPSIRTETGMKIPKPGAREWSNVIRPTRFAEKLTEVNQNFGGKVVPVIKLFKALNDSLPEPSQLSGYHMESLAVDAFKTYEGPATLHEMVKHLVEYSSKAVLKPIKDQTGQSLHVDDYLGSQGSGDRMRSAKAMERLSNRLNAYDSVTSLEGWEELF